MGFEINGSKKPGIMKKLIITTSVCAFLGLLQSAYFSLNSSANASLMFSYILLASLITGYAVYLLFIKTQDIMLGSMASVVIGAVIYNLTALLFDQGHILELLEPLMTLGAATGVFSLLVQILGSAGQTANVQIAEDPDHQA